jgi:hypothetical protein
MAKVDGNGTGFFAIDILTGSCRMDGYMSVPVVAGGNEYGVNILAFQEFAKIAAGFAVGIAIPLVNLFFDRFSPVCPNIANGEKLDIGLIEHAFQHVPTTMSDPDSSECDFAIGGNTVASEHCRWQNERRKGKCRGFQKISSSEHEIFPLRGRDFIVPKIRKKGNYYPVKSNFVDESRERNAVEQPDNAERFHNFRLDRVLFSRLWLFWQSW